MSKRFQDHKEALEELVECSELLMELQQKRVCCTMTFGAQDAEGGYGWSIGMCVILTLVGRQCSRPDCFYDETKPKEVLMKEESEFDLSGKSLFHRHSYQHTEREIGSWHSLSAKISLKEWLGNILTYVKETY